jgi:hypothetical protein
VIPLVTFTVASSDALTTHLIRSVLSTLVDTYTVSVLSSSNSSTFN